jgi:O-antigen ligase
MGKLNRFLILLLAWSIPVLFAAGGARRDKTLDGLLVLFCLGLGLKAAYDCIRVPTLVSMGVPLFFAGTMRDPQFYLAGICLALGMLLTRGWSWRYPPVLAGLLLSVAGIVLHFKRGAWVACLCAIVVMGLASRRWRVLSVVAGIVALMAVLPPVQERIAQLGREFDPNSGGRVLLWTKVAPVLIAEHPFGMGWKAVKHEDFTAITPRVEPRLNHLHNNILQITLELGWVGLSVWAYWMILVLQTFWKSYRVLQQTNARIAGVALGGLGAFSGLMINGMVEYNFGDSEIFMLMVFLVGLAAGVDHYARQVSGKNPV